ncbi:MAG: hypothetical protein II179_00215, partial [Alphaproteobacteria bacterium]|nr:hypothetical protein [Alphaproteobacteria bacterium]
GHSACTADAGTPYTIDAGKNYALNETGGEHCWCKMVGPEESPWVYNKSGDTMAGGCERSCALECLSALRAEPMRAAMFSVVKLNGSNANTSDERVIGNDLITAVTPPPPPKPKPAPTPKPEPQPDPCWKREWIGRYSLIQLDGTKESGINDPNSPSWDVSSGISSPGDWKIIFPCGAIISGVAKCASNAGKKWLPKGTPHGEGEYCWCKAETESTPYNFTPVWVFMRNYNNDDYANCANHCAEQCVDVIALHFQPVSALFGLKYEEYDD